MPGPFCLYVASSEALANAMIEALSVSAQPRAEIERLDPSGPWIEIKAEGPATWGVYLRAWGDLSDETARLVLASLRACELGWVAGKLSTSAHNGPPGKMLH